MMNPKRFFKNVGTFFKEGFSGITKAFDKIKKVGKPIGDLFKTMGTHIKKIPLGKMSKGFTKLGGTVLKKVFAPLQFIITGFKTVSRLFTDVSEILSSTGSVWEKTGLIIEAFFGRLVFFATDFAASFTDLFDMVVGGIAGIFGFEVPSLTDWLFGEDGPEGIYNSFIEIDWGYIPEMFDILLIQPVKDFFTGLATSIGETFTDISDWFTSIDVGQIVSDIVAGFTDLPTMMKDKFVAAADAAWSGFKGVFRFGSPSKLMQEAGGDLTVGLDNGTDFASVMKSGAELAHDAFNLAMNPSKLIEKVKTMMPAIGTVFEGAKGLVADGADVIAGGIESVVTNLASMGTIAADAMVTKVANGLAGDGSVAVQHEGLNIQVHFKVNIDSKDLAAALGDDAEGGPFFVINTDREAGGTESAEAAGE
jgi:hypothetical protein